MSKRHILFGLFFLQMAGLTWTIAGRQLHISVLAWLAILSGAVVLSFITNIVITNLLKEVYPDNKHSRL